MLRARELVEAVSLSLQDLFEMLGGALSLVLLGNRKLRVKVAGLVHAENVQRCTYLGACFLEVLLYALKFVLEMLVHFLILF